MGKWIMNNLLTIFMILILTVPMILADVSELRFCIYLLILILYRIIYNDLKKE